VDGLGGIAVEDPQVRDLLLDRAASDTNAGVRRLAVDGLGGIAVEDPQVRDLLLDRILPGNPPDFDRNWIGQVKVRIASCSREFEPGALPPIENDQGTF
jgi:hypothetical protein